MSDENEDTLTPSNSKAVGYANPPLETRFKPGKSGNARGRPPGRRNFKTDLKETLSKGVRVKAGGKHRQISTQQAALLILRDKGLKGDQRSIEKLLAYAERLDTPEDEKALSQDDQQVLAVYLQRIESGAAADPRLAAEAVQSAGRPGASASDPTQGGRADEKQQADEAGE
jgi:hypothetical protein